MKAHGIARLGRDAETRYTASGEPVVALALPEPLHGWLFCGFKK